MDSKSSYLSDPRCQCDFVVATTQASINSGLLEYLDEGTQPIQYLCFLEDDKGFPTEQISLEELINKSKGVNPFDIPKDIDGNDPRLDALADAGFAVGVMLQIGMPLGHTPKTLPPIVTLNSADNVTFNLFCRQVKVVSIRYARRNIIWNVFQQPEGPAGQPWAMKMSVNLTVAGLDKELDTPYFKSHPEVRDQLRKALVNLSGTAFSLQQLFYDLDNAVLQTVPDFSTVTDPDAKHVLETYFRNIYTKTAKEHGLPLVAVTAVTQPDDESTLKMTAFERIVNTVAAEPAATTLDHLCAINNNPVPRISGLDWNWMKPQDLEESSGIIAINRNILAAFVAANLDMTQYCFLPDVQSSGIYLDPLVGGKSLATVSASGSHVIHGEHRGYDEGFQELAKTTLMSPWLSRIFTQVENNYSLDVFFEERTIRVEQWSRINVSCTQVINNNLDSTHQISLNLIDKTRTDTYSISVSQNGALQLVNINEDIVDRSESPPEKKEASLDINNPGSWIVGIWDDILSSGTSRAIEGALDNIDRAAADLHELEISQLQSFVFPGARVFTYKDPFFSDHEDLVCKITYVDPVKVSPAQPQGHQQQQQQQSPLQEEQPSPVAGSPPVPPSLLPGSVGKLTASTELMQNYVQGQVVSPTGKFEALQSLDGHALLFAVDSSGVLNVFEEQSGTCHTGWQVHDLSTAAIRAQFPGCSATVRTFDVGQSAVDGTIGLMMAVSLDGNDHLFMSLANSNGDTSWTAHPTWTMVPFDAIHELPQAITITGALFAETRDHTQYLVVDIDRPLGNKGDPHIARYHIDPTRVSGRSWIKHDVTVDIATAAYQSVVGRVSGKPVDGIYTVGITGAGSPQLVYEPIINYYGHGPATPRRLHLPGGAIPSSMATARNPDGSTDLYATGEDSTLYRFASDKQEENLEPMVVLTNDLLSGTDTLRVMTRDEVTTLWGRNRSNQVYYITCLTSQVNEPGSWSAPMPILDAVERFSPYVNRVDGGNTIFVAGNGRLRKLMQGSAETGKVWQAQEITLAAPPEQNATCFMSYTSYIHVTQMDQQLSAPYARVNLSANCRIPVYINGLYYVLSTAPIQIATDATGSLTVIQATGDNFSSAILTVALENTSLAINPADQMFAKLTALDSAEKLRSAQFPKQTVAGGILGSPEFTPLVDPSIPDRDVQAVAQNLGLLREARDRNAREPKKTSHLAAASTMRLHLGDDLGTLAGDFGDFLGSIPGAISSAWGDTWQALENAAGSVGRLVYDTVTNSLHFLAKIGKQIYHVALDTLNAFIGAAQWVLKQIKTAWDMLKMFFQTLLNWGDICRTKNVIHNLIRLWLHDQVNKIPRARQALDSTISEVEKQVNKWARVSDWSPGLGEEATRSASGTGSDPSESLTPSAKLFSDKYRDHARELQILGDSPALDLVENLLLELLTAVSNEGQVLGAVFSQLQDLIKQFHSLSVVEILQKLAAILVDGTLSSVQVVVDALLNVLAELAQSALDVLDTKIHIPIISDLLNMIGVPDISFLDLFTWIGAVAVTVVYEVTEGHYPFPGGDSEVQTLTSAASWDEHQGPVLMSTSTQKAVFMSCHLFSGILYLVGNFVTGLEAEDQTESIPLTVGAIMVGLSSAASSAAGDFLVPMDPVDSLPFNILSYISKGSAIALKIVFSGLAQKIFNKIGEKAPVLRTGNLVVKDHRGTGAFLDAVLCLHDIVVTTWHFYELSQKTNDTTRSTAFAGEAANLASYVSRISYALAVNDEEQDTRLAFILVMGAANDVYGGWKLAEVATGASLF
ncbi:hypothetical protein BO94DRAFT_457575 [Aspergillus sclerotioniger CBS 115572]|uniref:Uncharacterized protein n=1 Tax=Aspergillus sclerotioniger CBS 115572 TaxID=1450535 RepID=A0A317X995_9EURO|nr:hypothetical protein BO94DRAFT_457575 [Aspergillus sclerotioniger CBS 115572]PWY94741.1 hypothetical protein BO94DRAFT_457575 [Aspergillus sclerotioniger CBS 115572]